MQKKKIQYKVGLTLIETLVAISVLLVSVVGPMVIYSRNISDARFAGNQTTAYYLAQEAIEFVKYRVYTNLNNGNIWMSGLNNCTAGNICRIDTVNNDLCLSTNPNCPDFIKLDNGVYNYNSGTDTIFKRDLSITDGGNGGDEAIVTATVTWTRFGENKNVTVSENIFKWQP